MPDSIILGAAFIIVAAILAMAAVRRPRRVFALTVKDGKVVRADGTCPAAYIKDVERICAFWSLRDGTVEGSRAGRRIRIDVGGGIPAHHRQTFQNGWNHPL